MTKSNSRIILLDVGGTFVKSSLGIAGQGAIEGTFASTPINSDGPAHEIADSFREAVHLQTRRAQEEGCIIEAISAALPGPFNYKEGIFMMKHKFASVYGTSFRDVLGNAAPSHVRLSFVHDVNAVLLGALAQDPTLSEGNVALSTFGTGLGFAYSSDGVIQESPAGSPARDIWNIPYQGGILEDFVSRRAILRVYVEQGGALAEGEDVKEISDRARAGEPNAIEAFRAAGRHYADGAKELIAELGIRRIMFAGQIAKSFDLMEEAIRKGLGNEIVLSVLDDIQGTVLKGLSNQ